METRAYAFALDVSIALGDALFIAAPQHFKLGSVTILDENSGSAVGVYLTQHCFPTHSCRRLESSK